MKFKSFLSINVLAILLLAIISGINNIPYVAGSTQFSVEGYNLTPHEGWTVGNVKGYCEDGLVPIRLIYGYRSEPSTTLVFRVGGDYYDEGEDAYGFDYFTDFTISGDYDTATIDYVGSPDGPYNFPWSAGPTTGELIDLPGDRGLTIRYIIEVGVPAAGSQQQEFTIEFLTHQSLTEFSGASIVKRGSYYWGSTNLLVGKDPSDAGQNTVPVSKCDEEPQPPTTTTTTTSDTTTPTTTTTTTSATTSTTDTTTTGTTTSTTECPTVTETFTQTITETFTDCTTTIGTTTTTDTTTATTTITTTEDCYLGDGGVSNFGKIQCEGPNVIVGASEEIGIWQGAVGTFPADWIDATAAALLWGLCTDGTLFWDHNTTEVNQGTGATILAGHEIMSGGPFVNGPVKYYEGAKLAPVYYKTFAGKPNFFSTEGTNDTVDDVQIVAAELSWSEVGPRKDMFIVELFQKPGTEADPEYAVISYGYGGRGTLAASIYFKTVIEPNLSSFTDSYYIVQWDDTNGNVHPDMPGTDTYTLVASGN
ncbi:hypothetical protein ACFLQ6_03685 [Thermoproteota archaeon]